jgi:putative transposase
VSKYEFIAAHQQQYPIVVMCRVLAATRSGFYAWKDRAPSQRDRDDAALVAKIRALHRGPRRNYGSPRIHAELVDANVKVGQKRIARLMRQERLQGRSGRRRAPRTTVPSTVPVTIPDLVQRRFVATAPNQLWVTDITYVRTWEGWLYVAAIVDVFSRRVVGWAMADHMRVELPLAALAMAVARRRPPRGLIHHSDRGAQYTSGDYQQALGRVWRIGVPIRILGGSVMVVSVVGRWFDGTS